LEIQERGILNFWIHVNYDDGLSQGIGGICLDTYDEIKKSRVGTAYGCEMIRRILIELKVNDFADMKNRHIWVIGTGDGLHFKPVGVQGLLGDGGSSDGLIFSDIAKEFEEDC